MLYKLDDTVFKNICGYIYLYASDIEYSIDIYIYLKPNATSFLSFVNVFTIYEADCTIIIVKVVFVPFYFLIRHKIKPMLYS